MRDSSILLSFLEAAFAVLHIRSDSKSRLEQLALLELCQRIGMTEEQCLDTFGESWQNMTQIDSAVCAFNGLSHHCRQLLWNAGIKTATELSLSILLDRIPVALYNDNENDEAAYEISTFPLAL